MSKNQNILKSFWQELKRRKVFKVIAMYAGSAFIIIQVIDILLSPLGMPPWIMTLVVILLSTGFPIVAVLAWIFDLTPQGIKKTESLEEIPGKEIVTEPVRRRLKAGDILIVILAIAVVILSWPKIFKQDKLEKLMSSGKRISVAVMPFRNMTNDTTWKIWQEGIQTSLISFLTNSGEFIVRGSVNELIQNEGLTNYASLTPSIENIIAKKLDANVFISGGIMNTGTKIRVTAQLFDTDKNEAIQSFEIEGPAREENLSQIIDSLRHQITDFFSVIKLEMSDPNSRSYFFDPVKSPDAYKYMASAQKAVDNNSAIEMYMNALKIDSNIYDAYCFIANSYMELGDYESGKRWALKYYSKYDKLDMFNKTFADYFFAITFKTPYDAIKCLKQMIVNDDELPLNYTNLGDEYYKLLQYDRAIPEYERALEIYERWDKKPGAGIYSLLAACYHNTGQYKKEKKLYKKVEKDFPGDPALISRQAILALSEGDSVGANQYIGKFRSILKDNLWSDARILRFVAVVQVEAGILNEGEKYYRQALSLEPESPGMINGLAYFLIDKDRNINEGLELSEKSLKFRPDNYNYLHTKGWGLYKQRKYSDALEILQKSWDLRQQKAIYDHSAYLHLEAAKKAVANHKNN